VEKNELFLIISIIAFLIVISPVMALDEWRNDTWHYRVKIEIDTTNYDTEDWPVEYEFNFTSVLENLGIYDDFDENSTRVFEYNDSEILYEVGSQFEKGIGFDPSSNAIGTLVFIMNGSTSQDTVRSYYVYFDTLNYGPKEPVGYTSTLAYEWNQGEINVNNSIYSHYIDTNRAENTSGLYRVIEPIGGGYTTLFSVEENNKTVEYVQYANGTHNLTFNLIDNASFWNGSERIIIEQKGKEIIWGDTTSEDQEVEITKRYYIYDDLKWMKIEQNITNLHNYSIQRNSTPAGALSLDMERGYFGGIDDLDGITSDPYSWYWAVSAGGQLVGVINYNETGTSNFNAENSSAYGRIGINLDTTTILSNSSLIQTSVVYIDRGGGAAQNFVDLRDRIADPPVITEQSPEAWEVIVKTETEHSIYNLGEGVIITGNITSDTYNFTTFINATIIPPSGPNQTIILYDNGSFGDQVSGDKVFTNYFNISSSDPIGQWNLTLKMYDNTSYFLNESYNSFNVTDIYQVTVNVSNPNGFPNRTVFSNIYVQNFLGIQNVPSATINCSYELLNGTDILLYNITDFLNGTYLLNFSAPVSLGTYTLACNATKDNNFGNGTDIFYVEPAKGFTSVSSQPQNYTATTIMWNVSESFDLVINMTNIGEGYIYDPNITLVLPENNPFNWTSNYTFYECGNRMYIDESCTPLLNITIPEKTYFGLYQINATGFWRNPDDTLNSTFTIITVNVTSNNVMEIQETLIEGIIGGGKEKQVGNFTIRSIGNEPINNITINITGLPDFNVTFIPSNFSSINGSSNETVLVNVSVPNDYLPGLYNGTINVSTSNANFGNLTLSITVSGTNMSVVTQPQNYTATTIMWNVSESFDLFVNITNIGNGTAYSSNITFQLPGNTPLDWFSNYTLYECGDITSLGDFCSATFNITVPERTAPGNYLINVSAVWLDPETGQQNTTLSFNTTVTSNPLLYIEEDVISNVAIHGIESILDNFTIQSIGNENLINISYNIIGLPSNFTLKLIQNVTNLTAGENASIQVNVVIPPGYDPGVYNGSLNVTTINNGYKNLSLEVTVPINRTWNISQDYCEKPMYPSQGTLCLITANNTGNVEVNITITPPSSNLTWVSETNFTVSKQDSHDFSVLYDIGDSDLHFNYSTYIIDANQTDSVPDYIILKTVLTPYVGPLINISFVPSSIEQTDSIEIYANLTDRSGQGIQWVRVNVTTPDNITYSRDMDLVGVVGPNITQWNATYPTFWGNTTLRGDYEVVVYSLDNVSAFGNNTDSFYVYTKLVITLYSMSDNYTQGETGSIYYRSKESSGIPLKGVNTTLTIRDPNQLTIFNFSYETDPAGYIQPLPQFILPSDATIGYYNLTSFSSYYDSDGFILVSDTSNYSFIVQGEEGFLNLDLESPFEVATGEDLQVVAVVTDGKENVDADTIVASLYDPVNNNILLNFPMTRTDVGRYILNYTTTASSNQGNWKWVVSASKDNNNITKEIFSRLIGGPLDVRDITIIDNTIPELEISSIVENTGSATFDVFIEWNLTRTDTGEMLDSGLDTVRIDGNTEHTYTFYPGRNNDIDYVGEVRITIIAYYSGTEKAGAYEIFDTEVGVTTTTVPGPGPSPGPAPSPPEEAPAPPPAVAKIEIVKYPQEMTIERGWVRYPSIIVNNTGETSLRDIVLTITGIPGSWYTIEPAKLDLLPVGDSVIFNIKLEVPISADATEYYGMFKVDSSKASDEKMFALLVFESREELLEYEIKKLKKEIQDFEAEVERAKEQGKDVREVERLLEEAKIQVGYAEDYLLRKMYDDALESVFVARNLLDRAKYALSIAPYIEHIFLPTWLIIVLIILAIVILAIFIWSRRMGIDLSRIMRPSMKEVKEAVQVVKEKPEEKEALLAERDKVNRMLKLLETERKEGIISNKAYKELKFRNETKLAEIEKKLQETSNA
jgi:uncharacterized membrane protein